MTGLSEIRCRPEIIGQLQGILLNQALLCVDCEVVYPVQPITNNAVCPNCTSHSYIKLSDVINKSSEEKSISQ